MTFHAYAAKTPKGKLEPFEFDPGPLGAEEVEIAVTHCGLCHSDVHLIDGDWGRGAYPMVPGHEAVGTVAAVGHRVETLKIGDRVGVGWQAGACFKCEWCVKGDDNLCDEDVPTCVGRPGGYADRLRADARFAFRIPEALSSAGAAPLLCGGITVYSPLRQYDVKPSMKVGVVGVGGLGHLALKFARAFGCEVTAFSHSMNKEEEVRKLGAHRFVHAGNAKALEAARGTMDVLLAAPAVNIDWATHFSLLRPKGRMIVVGAPSAPISLPPGALISGQKSLSGSAIGPRWLIHEMLEFSARHGIEALVETLPMNRVNEAVEKVRKGKARYRVVLEV